MYDTSNPIGRPISAGLTQPNPPTDKWQILNDLTLAANAFGISHRSLAVLKALMTFLPDRHIAPDHGPAVVFPSNRTLADRLTGMPESTLRRHLAALVNSGLITRRDSPNRKRFARRIHGAGGIAFGFDLSPLARTADTIAKLAQQARALADQHAVLRARLLELCHLRSDAPQSLIDQSRKALRRKDNSAELQDLITQLTSDETEETSVCDIENERHIQKAEKKETVLKETKAPNLQDVRRVCKAARGFYPDQMGTWPETIETSRALAPMIGVERSVLKDAENSMGPAQAATTILCMLERLTTIHNPGGYLRRLSQLAKQGKYDAGQGLMTLKLDKLSADNLNYC